MCSAILFVHLPSANTSPLENSQRASDHTDDSSRAIGPGKLGAIASECSICSRHGIQMLEMGGNAADAVSIVHYDLLSRSPARKGV